MHQSGLARVFVVTAFLAANGMGSWGMADDQAGAALKPMASPAPKLAVDAAHSWLIPANQFDAGAALIAQAGFACARERMNWGEVESTRGEFRWGKYDLSANAARDHGLQVCQVFHSIPPWARSDRAANRYPDDLRDTYNFCRAAALHFQGRVQTWEVWNEADIREFSPETGDAYAAFLKAAYLGFKRGNPEVQVTQVSMALGAGSFEEALFRNDTAAYMDIFNYHIYDQPSVYPARAQGHFDLMDQYRLPGMPVWLTEAGIVLQAVSGTLSNADRQKQADFIPKSYAMSLASSTDRHFFFVFPHYLENGHEFGALDAQMRPYPGYQALKSVTAMLGKAAYLGRVKLGEGRGLDAHLFDNGIDHTLIIWHDGGPVTVPLPQAAKGASIYNCMGDEIGKAGATLDAGASPRYLRTAKGAIHADGKSLATRRVFGPRPPASTTVVRVVPPAGLGGKDIEAYRVKAGQSIDLQVEVYNFSDHAGESRCVVEPPPGWQANPSTFSAPIGAMGRQTRTVSVLPGSAGGLRRQTLRFNLEGPAGSSGTAVLDVLLDPASLKPSAREPLRLSASERWAGNISANGAMTVAGSNETEPVFEARFDRPGDRWIYPTVGFTAARDWRGFDAIELETRIDPAEPGTVVRLMVTEPSGAAYFTGAGFNSGTEWTRAVVPFKNLVAGGFAPPDPNGRLDLDQITSLKIGCNTGKDAVVLRVRNVALVRY